MAEEIKKLLAAFPKTRLPLTAAHEKIYAEEYQKTRGDDKPLTSKISAGIAGWMHRKVAAEKIEGEGETLEIGAGTLNHLPYENGGEYDIIEPFTALFEHNPLQRTLRNIYQDIRDIPPGQQYNRIISVAVLEHLTELPFAVARAGLLLKEDGMFQAGIPAEGGLLWGAAWRCSTGIAYRLRTKLDYKTLVRHEHVNTAKEIVAIARHFFGEVKLSYFPMPPIHVSLFVYIEARAPKKEICSSFTTDYLARNKDAVALAATLA